MLTLKDILIFNPKGVVAISFEFLLMFTKKNLAYLEHTKQLICIPEIEVDMFCIKSQSLK